MAPLTRTMEPLSAWANNITDTSWSLAHKQVCVSNNDPVTNTNKDDLKMQKTQMYLSYTKRLMTNTQGTLLKFGSFWIQAQ